MDEDVDADFNDLDPARVDEDMARVRVAVRRQPQHRCRGGARPAGHGGRRTLLTLRWILVHMIEEYARHNGHADLLREAIDGAVGE